MSSTQHLRVSRLSRSQYARMRRAFSALRWYKLLSQVRKHNVHVSSNSHVGEVSLEELSVIMQCLRIKHTDLELKACVRRVDIRGKGTINFNDFMSMMASTVEKKVSDREIHQAFMVFDRDNDGVISPNELRFVMDIVGERLSDDQLKAIMKEADIDGDGVITYGDFCQLVRLE